MEYYVLSNLSHNGESFRRGDRITLVEQHAKPLIEAGVIQTEPVEATVSVQEPAKSTQVVDIAAAGGKPHETGEPSLDGSHTRAGVDTATDITPKVDEKEPEPVPGSLVGRFLNKITGADTTSAPEPLIATSTSPEPQVTDPSANL